MNYFIMILVAAGTCLAAVFAPTPGTNAPETKDSILHHTCKGQSTLGGSCTATCTDAQSCSCNTGLVTCSCDCNPLSISANPPGQTVDPGPQENWQKVSEALKKESNATAQSIGNSMLGVYALFKTDRNAYERRTKEIEAQFQALPEAIQLRAISVLK